MGVVLLAPDGRADDRRVEMGAGQTTTVVGSFDSLAELLADLCRRAHVELRAFDAADHPIATDQVARPLIEVIARVLSKENYLLGIREGELSDQAPEIAWIRVTGSRDSGTEALGGGLTVPSRFGARAFEDESLRETRRAQQAVADRLLADDRHVAQFLALDARQLARSLRQYPHIEDLLREMRAGQPLAVATKLDAVIHELEAMADSGPE